MNKINIKLLKKIREETKISIYECKKALDINNHNYEKTINYLKNKICLIKKNKKLKEGIILNKKINNKASMIEINCETDFTNKNKEIIDFAEKILCFIIKNESTNLIKLKKIFHNEKQYLINKFKELIKINKFCFLKSNNINIYLHNFKIGTILSVKNIINKKLKIKNKKIKKIAMHITAINCNNEKTSNNKHLTNKSNLKIKSNNLLDINVNKNKINFLNQPFIFNNKISLNNYLQKNNIKIDKFYKFKIKK